jgi:hypothetical protein
MLKCQGICPEKLGPTPAVFSVEEYEVCSASLYRDYMKPSIFSTRAKRNVQSNYRQFGRETFIPRRKVLEQFDISKIASRKKGERRKENR